MLGTCFKDYYYDLPVTEKALDHKYKPKTLFLEAYNYKPWFLYLKVWCQKRINWWRKRWRFIIMALLGRDGKEKKGKGLQFLTPSKLLIRLPMLLAQKEARDNSYKLRKKG